MGRRQRDAEEHQPERGETEAEPLATADLQAEHALGHDREEHDAAREHRLDERQRRDGHRRDVEDPRPGGDEHAEREQARGEQRLRRPQRTLDVDCGGGAGAAMLVEEAHVRCESAREREQNA